MTAWEFVSPNRSVAVVEIFVIKGVPCAPYESIRLKGLDSAAVYVERTTGKQYSGEALMHIGLKRRCSRDYSGEILVLDKM